MSQTEKALREALDTLVAVVGLTAFKYEGQRKPLQEAIDNARAALSLPETQGEPVAYLYTLEYGSDVANRMVSIEKLNYPFGVCGSDYLAKNDKGVSYVRQTPLYAAPPSQPAQPAQGMVMVPVEPTPEMWDAAWNSIVLPYRAKLSMHEIKTLFDLFHKAMLAAAPAAPTQAKPTNEEGA